MQNSLRSEYKIWAGMKQRCHNKNNPNFKSYGGKGIFVCDKWKDSFSAFFLDMGPRPTAKHSIDRIDNSKGYMPSNCRWLLQCHNLWRKVYKPRVCDQNRTLNIYVDRDEHKQIKEEAKKRKVSVSDLLVVAFKDYLLKEEVA